MKKMNYKPNTEIVVDKQCELLSFLQEKIENKSKNNIKTLLANGNISVDGTVTTKHNYPLIIGQTVLVRWSLIRIKTRLQNDSINIIYEDNDIIVINKPTNLLSVATLKESDKTAFHMVLEYVKHNNSNNKIFIVHRLDKDTSGVMLIAKNETAKHILQDHWDNIVVTRGYIGIVEGHMDEPEGTLKSWLLETTTNLVYSSKTEGDGKLAITNYKKIKLNNRFTMLEIRIDTGRKNQIRVQLNDTGHPIIGDKKYGAKFDPLRRLALHANVLEFKHPITGKLMHFEAPIPEEFNKLFK